MELPDDFRITEESGPVTLRVDGEVFTVEVNAPGSFAYSWISGPHRGFGFSQTFRTTAGPVADRFRYLSVAEHQHYIREWLAGIDPVTGYTYDD